MVTGRETFRINGGPRRSIRPGRRASRSPRSSSTTTCRWRERAVPEWRATLDALQALPEIGVEAPIGYAGVSLGVVTGLMLTAVESRIAAVSFGGVFVYDALIEAAGKITVPVEYRIPWDDEEFDRTSGVALFDAFASKEKTLRAHSGRHYPVPEYERDSSARFFARHLSRAAVTATD
jgi:hypothetical protein